MGPLRLPAWGPVKHNVQMHFRLRGAFHFPEQTGQTLPVVMRISILIKTIQPDQILKSMNEGDGFSSKTLGKSLFHFQNERSGHGQAGQFRLLESAWCPGTIPAYGTHWVLM